MKDNATNKPHKHQSVEPKQRAIVEKLSKNLESKHRIKKLSSIQNQNES